MRARLVETIAPWATGVVLAAPVVVAFYPPMTDLPFHEAAIGILRHFGDAAMFPPGLYLHNLGEPNQLFHLLGWALSYFVPTRWAAKLVVAASLVAVPVCAGRFARHTGANPLAALVVAPMALGWMFSWGLVANLLGLAALLAMLPQLDRYAARPTLRSAAGAALGAVLFLYLAHEAMMFVYGLMAFLLAATCPWSPGRTAARLAPLAAVILVHEVHIHWVQQFLTPAVSRLPVIWHSPWHKIQRIPYIVLPATDSLVQTAMLALCAIAIGSFFWLRTRERRGERPVDAPAGRVDRLRAWAYGHRFELFALACLCAYFVLPYTLSGATLVYQRFFPPAYAVLAVTAAPRDLWIPSARLTRLAVAALPVATLFATWPSFADSDRQYRALEDLLPHVEPGSAVAGIDLGPGDRSRAYSLGPAMGRVLATRGGRLSYAFTDSPISPVVIARRYRWNESLLRIAFDSWAFRPRHDLRQFRYLLLRTTDPALAWVATYALKTEADYVAESGDWVLFRSKLPVVALTSSDVRLETPPPESIRDRVQKTLATMREAPSVDVPPEPAPGGVGGRPP